MVREHNKISEGLQREIEILRLEMIRMPKGKGASGEEFEGVLKVQME
jgi:hypothetical protein